MNMADAHFTQSEQYNFNQIKSLIEDSLMYDWSISIEYAVINNIPATEWRSWDKKFFAIQDTNEVMGEIVACCRANPECSMKLICERFYPQCRLIYCIHQNRSDLSSSL